MTEVISVDQERVHHIRHQKHLHRVCVCVCVCVCSCACVHWREGSVCADLQWSICYTHTATVCVYLSQSVGESDGKEEVGISGASVYPEVP